MRQGTFIVDAFAAAAASQSLDSTSGAQGGLLGRRLKQVPGTALQQAICGECRCDSA